MAGHLSTQVSELNCTYFYHCAWDLSLMVFSSGIRHHHLLQWPLRHCHFHCHCCNCCVWLQHHFLFHVHSFSGCQRFGYWFDLVRFDLEIRHFDHIHWSIDHCWSVLLLIRREKLLTVHNRLVASNLPSLSLKQCWMVGLFVIDVHALYAVAKCYCVMWSYGLQLACLRYWCMGLLALAVGSNPLWWYYCYFAKQPNSSHCLLAHRHSFRHQQFHLLLLISIARSVQLIWIYYFISIGLGLILV